MRKLSRNKLVIHTILFSLCLTSFYPTAAQAERKAGVFPTVAACLLALGALHSGARAQNVTRPAERPAAVREEKRLSEKLPNSSRVDMSPEAVREGLKALREEMNQELTRSSVPSATAPVQVWDSFATRMADKAVKKPVYLYLLGTIVAGELLLLGWGWRYLRYKVAQAQKRLDQVPVSKAKLTPHLEALAKAEEKLVRSLRQEDATTREALLKEIEQLPEPERKFLETVLKDPIPSEEQQPIDKQQAWDSYLQAYDQWQRVAALESIRLELKEPPSLKELTEKFEERARFVHGLAASRQVQAEVENGLRHIDHDAARITGRDLKLRQRIWGKTWRFLVLAAIPAIALALVQGDDVSEEANRRKQDLESAAQQDLDRQKSLQTLIPALHRPLLWTAVSVWREDLRLAQYACPLTLRPVEEENPDLWTVQGLTYQILLDWHRRTGRPLHEFRFNEEFFQAFFQHLFALNPGLDRVDAKTKEKWATDMAYRAVRIFDEVPARRALFEVNPDAEDPAPPIGLKKK